MRRSRFGRSAFDSHLKKENFPSAPNISRNKIFHNAAIMQTHFV